MVSGTVTRVAAIHDAPPYAVRMSNRKQSQVWTSMSNEVEFDGAQCVVLPVDYMDSIEVAVESHAGQIAAVAANLRYPQYGYGALRAGIAGLSIWLAPAIWMTCQ